MSAPPDGAAAERTAFAWTRTAVSLLVALLVLFRLVLARLETVAVVALLVGVPLCVALLVLARRRSRGAAAAVEAGGVPPDALLPVGTAAAVTLLGLVELTHVLWGLDTP